MSLGKYLNLQRCTLHLINAVFTNLNLTFNHQSVLILFPSASRILSLFYHLSNVPSIIILDSFLQIRGLV